MQAQDLSYLYVHWARLSLRRIALHAKLGCIPHDRHIHGYCDCDWCSTIAAAISATAAISVTIHAAVIAQPLPEARRELVHAPAANVVGLTASAAPYALVLVAGVGGGVDGARGPGQVQRVDAPLVVTEVYAIDPSWAPGIGQAVCQRAHQSVCQHGLSTATGTGWLGRHKNAKVHGGVRTGRRLPRAAPTTQAVVSAGGRERVRMQACRHAQGAECGALDGPISAWRSSMLMG